MMGAALLLGLVLAWPADLELADGVACECGSTCVAVIDRNSWDGPVNEWDDEAHRRHVHGYAWKSTGYRCAACRRVWTVFEESPPCPVCGWSRLNQCGYACEGQQ